jgi:hypothetical protein
MKNLIKLRTPLCFIVVIGAVALLANLTSADEHHSKRGSTGPTHPTPTATPTSAAAKGKSTGPTKPAPPPHVTDLRAKIAQMKLNEGSNVIHSEGGIKFTAEVKGGKVVGYGATDGNGKALTGHGEVVKTGRTDAHQATARIAILMKSTICIASSLAATHRRGKARGA